LDVVRNFRKSVAIEIRIDTICALVDERSRNWAIDVGRHVDESASVLRCWIGC
jgi:hypothetical protein